MLRNITLEGMFTIDEINIINVNTKTIIVTTDEDMVDMPLSNISNSSLRNVQSYNESTNAMFPEKSTKFFQNDSDSIITSASTESNYETTQLTDDRNILDEKFSLF